MSYVVCHWNSWWVELIVIWSSAGLVDHAAGDAAHQQTIIDSKFDDSIQTGVTFLEKTVQLLTVE